MIAKFLDNGDVALGVFNFTDNATDRWHLTITCDNFGLPLNCGKTFEAVDLWTGEVRKSFNGTIEIQSLDAHACRLFRIKIIDK